MEFEQAQNCFEQFVLSRWPDWSPSRVTKGDWIHTFQNYEENRVKKALFDYAQKHTRFKSPSLPKVNEILKVSSFGYNKKQPDPTPLFWLMRTKDKTARPIYPRSEWEANGNNIADIADGMAKMWTEFYQDEWVPVRSREIRLEITDEPDPEAGMMSIDELASAVEKEQAEIFEEDIPF